MKITEAPEKIILSADKDTKEFLDTWCLDDYTDNIKIEYIQTDVVIDRLKKALIALFTFPFMSEEELKMIEVKIDLICNILKK